MKDFVCERCRYIIDNSPPPEDVVAMRCRFCDEPKGIMIYVDKNSKTVNTASAKRTLLIGWAHVACIYWHAHCSFADQTRLEVKQELKLIHQVKNKCKYCQLDPTAFRTSNCGANFAGQRCGRSFHVRCAIRRGLITDFETMCEFQMDPTLRRPVAMCSRHTLEQRLLAPATEECPSYQSNAAIRRQESEEESDDDI